MFIFNFKYGYFRLLKKTAPPPSPTPSHRTVQARGIIFRNVDNPTSLFQYFLVRYHPWSHDLSSLLTKTEGDTLPYLLEPGTSLPQDCHLEGGSPSAKTTEGLGRSGQVSSQKGTLWHLVSKAEATRSLSDRSPAAAALCVFAWPSCCWISCRFRQLLSDKRSVEASGQDFTFTYTVCRCAIMSFWTN
jgi:hypothetical protein